MYLSPLPMHHDAGAHGHINSRQRGDPEGWRGWRLAVDVMVGSAALWGNVVHDNIATSQCGLTGAHVLPSGVSQQGCLLHCWKAKAACALYCLRLSEGCYTSCCVGQLPISGPRADATYAKCVLTQVTSPDRRLFLTVRANHCVCPLFCWLVRHANAPS